MKRIRIITLSLCLIILTGLLPINVIAENANATLTVFYTHEKTPIVGAAFNVYLIAVPDMNDVYHPTDEFKDFPVDFSPKTDEDMYNLATTLEGYVLFGKITPLFTGYTNKEGTFVFNVNKEYQPKGLYLIIGEQHTQDNIIYTSEAFAVFLPSTDNDGNVQYEITAHAKYNTIHQNTPPTSRKVIKIWNDKNAEADRPESIEVTLLKNGKAYETVELNKDNNWTHFWYDLDGTARWNIIEKPVNDYKIVLTSVGNTYYFTNIKKVTPPPPENLPQTGQLWWPVPVLAVLGLIFITIGAVCFYKKKKIEE